MSRWSFVGLAAFLLSNLASAEPTSLAPLDPDDQTPPMVLASTYLEVGRLLERSGERPRAIQMYTRAATVFGGTSETRAAATRALDRLRSSPSSVRSFFP